MTKKLYIGNLPFSATEAELREVFEQHGTVESINVITDRETGRPRGFAFIEMEDAGADAARQALDGKDLGGRNIRVDEAHDRRGGGGGGGGRGGGAAAAEAAAAEAATAISGFDLRRCAGTRIR